MFYSGSPKHKMLLAIVGPSIGSGIFLGLAIMVLEREYASVELRLVSLGCDLLLAGGALYIAIESCRKVLKLIP